MILSLGKDLILKMIVNLKVNSIVELESDSITIICH